MKVKLPELGDSGNEEATVSFIIVDPDEMVNEGDSLIEMATEKATFDVPSPASGQVKEILIEEDQILKVGQVILTLNCE